MVDVNGMPTSYPLYASPAPAGTLKDQALTASCNPSPGRGPTPPGVTCGDYAVNTIQPFYQPFSPGTAEARRLPPQMAPTIGDRLSAKRVDWAWYSGGWSNADGDVGAPGWTNGSGPSCSDPAALATATLPNCPDKLFQFHHQPLNYFAAFAPGTAARAAHLRDEAEFEALAAGSKKHCQLKPVSFIKPVGAENEHPGYASESTGSDHLVELLSSIQNSRCAKDTMVVVTYDESAAPGTMSLRRARAARPVRTMRGVPARASRPWCWRRGCAATSSSTTSSTTRPRSFPPSSIAWGWPR